MNGINNYQLMQMVNKGIADMKVPITQQITNNVFNCIMPLIKNQFDMALQVNQATINSLLIQNKAQIMQIARLSQTQQEMPRMFAVNPVNGFGYCMDRGKEKVIGKIKIKSIYNCIIEKKGIKKTIKYIGYYDSNDEFHHTIVPLDKLAGKNLLTLFEGFIYICRSKELANDYLSHCINNFNKEYSMLFPEYPGFCFFNNDDKEVAFFKCNDGVVETELLKECSPYYVKKIIPKGTDDINDINYAEEICDKYLNTDEKMFLFVYSVCGLLSSFFKEINCPMEQFLVISAPNSAAVRLAAIILQIFNRGENILSFDSSKSNIEKAIVHAKDETVIINDCSLIDNDKRRTDMLQHILSVNDNNECQPHNLAIFSSHAQFILPSEKKICITLPDDFAANMTKAMETEMCKALNILINIITNYISENYAEFKKQFANLIWNINKKIRNKFSNNESAVSYAILSAVQWYVKDNIFQIKKLFKAEYVIAFINKIFMESPALSGTSADAVCEQFITSLNKAIRNGKLNITYHSKKMNFIEGTNQIIVKDDLLVMEENTVKNVILPAMRTTDNICRTLKCLDECEYLHSTKKNRYPLVVYSKGKSLRPTFIAIKSNGILDSDVDRMIQESEYSEWFMPSICNENFIPVADNGIGNTAYQEFNFEKANNMHFFAIGKSDSGKTHCLVERMCSLQKLHNPIIIFDTSKSFTEDEIVETLSVCGNSDTEKR